MEELLRGLNDLVSAGKTHHAALSNFPAWRVSRAVTFADLKDWAPIVGIQHEYSLVERTADRELLPMADCWTSGSATATSKRSCSRRVRRQGSCPWSGDAEAGFLTPTGSVSGLGGPMPHTIALVV